MESSQELPELGTLFASTAAGKGGKKGVPVEPEERNASRTTKKKRRVVSDDEDD